MIKEPIYYNFWLKCRFKASFRKFNGNNFVTPPPDYDLNLFPLPHIWAFGKKKIIRKSCKQMKILKFGTSEPFTGLSFIH